MSSVIDELVKSFTPIMNNIILLLIGVTIVIIISIIALAYTTTTRTASEGSRERILETLVSEEEAPSSRRRQRTGRRELGEQDVSLLKMLDSRESLPVDTLKEEAGESPRVLSERLARLREEGLIEVSGGVITLTRRGKRIMELMREKYWYRELEKKRRE